MCLKQLVFLFFSLCAFQGDAQQIGVNTQTPDASAMLDVVSTTSGFLPPRMSEAQMNAIASPSEALMVYCADCTANKYRFFDGNSWVSVGGDGGSGSSGSGSNPAFIADCIQSGFGGHAFANQPITSFQYSIDIVNGPSSRSMTFAASDVALSGLGGVLVSSVTPTSTTLSPGQRITVTYGISGTPDAEGNLNIQWANDGATCSGSTTIDGDLIAMHLTTNLGTYNSAIQGSWVAVTKSEYEAVANGLSSVTRFATAENLTKAGIRRTVFATHLTTIIKKEIASPSNQYVIGFKFGAGTPINGGNDIVRLTSNNNATNALPYGANLPNGIVDDFQQHYIFKGASTLFAQPQYLGITSDNTGNLYYNTGSGQTAFQYGNLTSAASNYYTISMQGLSTSTKQWP